MNILKSCSGRRIYSTVKFNFVPRHSFHHTRIITQKEFEITEETLSQISEKKNDPELVIYSESEPLSQREDAFMDLISGDDNGRNDTKYVSSPFVSRAEGALKQILDRKLAEPKFVVFEDDEPDVRPQQLQNDSSFDVLDKLFEITPKEKKVIILNPKTIYNARRKRFSHEPATTNTQTRNSPFATLFQDPVENDRDETEDLFHAVELLRPKWAQLQTKQYDEVVQNLSALFTKAQLKKYITSYPNATYHSSYNKKRLSDYILSDIWRIEKAESVSTVKELIREEIIPLTARELRLLLSDSGVVIFNWRSLGADIAVDANQRLIVRAPVNVLRYIRVVINNLLTTTKTEVLNVTGFDSVGNTPLMDYLSSITNVVYERDNSDAQLTLYSLKQHRIVTFKQLLLHSLAINPVVDNVYSHGTEGEKFEVNDTVSIPEIYNYKKWYRYEVGKKGVAPLIDEFFDDVMDYETINDDIRELMMEQLLLEPLLEDIKRAQFDRNLEDSMNHFKNNSETDIEEQIELEFEDNVVDEITESTDLLDIDKAYEKLSTNDSILATFGSILVDETDENKIFNTHLPFVNKTISELPLYNSKSSLDKDNFDYIYVIKLIPNPYKDITSTSQYPPIEFWFETKGNFIDVSSMRIMQTKAQTNLHYSLPNEKSDLRLTSDTVLDIDTDLDGEWLSGQRDILRFLEDCGFSATDFKESQISESCTIKLGDDEVEYMVVGTQQRRQLELRFHDLLLQYSIVDNGHYGGRNLEVNLIGDSDMTRNEFSKFVNTLIEFIKELK